MQKQTEVEVPVVVKVTVVSGEPQRGAEGEFESTAARIVKREDEEQFVLGEVLVPEEVDSQGDIVSAAEIRKAAHEFMLDSQRMGEMHTEIAPDVRVVESYLAPVDLKIGDEVVKAGSWLLGVKILDDETWQKVKKGEYTGFSIGGSAYRDPVE